MDLAKAEELFWQDGEVGEDCSAWLIAEVKRLQEEPSGLFYQLRDEVAQITKDRDHERFHREAAEAENERLQSSLTLSREEGRRDKEDAERWRAVIGCARVRVLGSAGVVEPKPDKYAHIGVELWTKHNAGSEPVAVEWLTKFADIAAAIRSEAKGERE